ncbi:MAG: VCBS repeat-containing protein, partial [Myxococcales bacterium]|nr:VCBS repeat-containing protein [Myxococcales bacterium]
CSEFSCATKPDESTCDEGYTCDADLGLCVPTQADPNCQYIPPPAQFAPRPQFTWGERKQVPCMDESVCQTAELCQGGFCTPTWPHLPPADSPEHVHVSSIPLVADLDGNCVPEIVFNTYNGQNYTTNGILRAIRGDTGAKVWTFSDANYRSDSGATPAIGDLNYDGIPEVINPGQGSWLYAVDNQGNFLWQSDNYAGSGKSGSPSLANMDLQGDAEVVYGRTIFDSQGSLIWQGTGHEGNNGSVGKLSCVADLDGDLRPEVIAGGTAWHFTGTVGTDFMGSQLWTNGTDGFCGIADFQLDGIPEVVVVRSNAID